MRDRRKKVKLGTATANEKAAFERQREGVENGGTVDHTQALITHTTFSLNSCQKP